MRQRRGTRRTGTDLEMFTRQGEEVAMDEALQWGAPFWQAKLEVIIN